MIENVPTSDPMCPGCVDEILRVRQHSLFVPREFDVSACFAVITRTLAMGFDPQAPAWRDEAMATQDALT